MYYAAPFNQFFKPELTITDHQTEILIKIERHHYHAGGNVHGSIYFKMLDDASFFAAQSMEYDVFLVTTSFTTYLTRPVSTGVLKSIGQVVNYNRSQFITESILYNSDDKEIGRGNGIFVRSKMALDHALGYTS